MSSKTSALRLLVESSLAARAAKSDTSRLHAGMLSPFQHREHPTIEAVPTGAPPIDQLAGGFPRGCLTEIYGPPCSGRSSLLISALASRTAASEVCALVDARDAFDPHSAQAAGVKLAQLLWVRCRNVDQALRATDLLIQGGGFGLIALDLGDTPPQLVRYIPLQAWFRFRRAVEHTPTIFLVIEQESNAKTCASLVLSLRMQETLWSHTGNAESGRGISWHSTGCLLEGRAIRAEMIRSHSERTRLQSSIASFEVSVPGGSMPESAAH